MSHHQDHEAEHTPAAIRRRLEARPSQDYLKDSIYGAIDGAVTTFAVVSSVAGAGLSSGIVIILGLANLLADGFSMASGNFLATRAENQAARKARREEEKKSTPIRKARARRFDKFLPPRDSRERPFRRSST